MFRCRTVLHLTHMGMFSKSCGTGYTLGMAPAPNPRRFSVLAMEQFQHAHVLTVRYPDATNFEGVKVMVFRGQYVPRDHLDPHFTLEPTSPIARFRPNAEGRQLARDLASALGRDVP